MHAVLYSNQHPQKQSMQGEEPLKIGKTYHLKQRQNEQLSIHSIYQTHLTISCVLFLLKIPLKHHHMLSCSNYIYT